MFECCFLHTEVHEMHPALTNADKQSSSLHAQNTHRKGIVCAVPLNIMCQHFISIQLKWPFLLGICVLSAVCWPLKVQRAQWLASLDLRSDCILILGENGAIVCYNNTFSLLSNNAEASHTTDKASAIVQNLQFPWV